MGEADDYTYCKLFQRIENKHFPATIVKYSCQYKNGFEIEIMCIDKCSGQIRHQNTRMTQPCKFNIIITFSFNEY